MYHEYYILGNYTTTFIRYSFFSTEKRIKRKKHLPSDCVGCKFFLIFILISERMKDKTGHRQPPNPQYLNKTKIITFYIYHHIDTQPFEFHLADRTPPATWTTAQPCLPSCSVFRFFIQSYPHTFCPIVRIFHHWLALIRHRQFLVFLSYWRMRRQVFQTCLHSFTIIHLL